MPTSERHGDLALKPKNAGWLWTAVPSTRRVVEGSEREAAGFEVGRETPEITLNNKINVSCVGDVAFRDLWGSQIHQRQCLLR